jgi:membrane protein
VRQLFNRKLWAKRFSRLFGFIEAKLVQLNERTGGLFFLLARGINRFTQYGTHEAAALSYYALFSLFPLLLLAIVLSASLLGDAAASDQISDVLSLFLPGDTANILENAVEAALQNRGSVSIFAVIVLGWSSANLFGNLEKVLSHAFGTNIPRRIYQRRLIGVTMISIFTLFLIASLLTNLLFGLLELIFLNSFTPWLRIASLTIPVGFNAAIFAMLYGFLPRVHLRWDAIWPAAILGGVAFEVAKRAFVWYLQSLSVLDYVYGSVTTVIIFLLWAFYSFCLILLGAEICAALDKWMDLQEMRRRGSVEEKDQPPLLDDGQSPLPLDEGQYYVD